ncbi:MAG: hypothetical protein ACYCYO_00020 [Bacilli bacterium]
MGINRGTNEYISDGFREANSKPASRSEGEADVTIVNTRDHGKRIMIASKVVAEIGADAAVQIAWDDGGLAIGARLPGCQNSYTLRQSGSKSVVYSVGLVDEVTDAFGLDFSGRSSLSFTGVIYLNTGEGVAAFVPIRGQQEDADTALESSRDGL